MIEWMLVATNFRSAIVEVQARLRTVIPYVANYSLAQFFVGLTFVGNACCVYSIVITNSR